MDRSAPSCRRGRRRRDPALRGTGPDGGQIAEARKAEEDEAKKMLSDLEKLGVDGEGFDAQLETFRLAVLAHADSEEREVFPRLRQSLDADALRSMRTALETAEAMAPTHPHPHGPESALGNNPRRTVRRRRGQGSRRPSQPEDVLTARRWGMPRRSFEARSWRAPRERGWPLYPDADGLNLFNVRSVT